MQQAASAVAGRHDFSAFSDKRLKEDESRIVVVERCELARAGELILVRIAASHFLWKMVRKLISYFVEVGRGNVAPADIASRLHARGEVWQPTAPPSGLFLEGVVYERERFERPLLPIVPVESRR
jgi:tRNA pseudouridine38-40 synthase